MLEFCEDTYHMTFLSGFDFAELIFFCVGCVCLFFFSDFAIVVAGGSRFFPWLGSPSVLFV